MSAKIVKNTSYFSRYQTQFRRRRECKTEYVQRSALIQQDNTKYAARKYRLVARVTNHKIIAQIISADVDHDVTLCQANSVELKNYGIALGLTNYAAAYCVGLLVARRLLKKVGMDEIYTGPIKEGSDDEDDEKRRPFRVILDVGLRRTTTGARVFGVMKGAVDGGLLIPHSDKRIAGGDKEKKQRYFVVGGHVADYMKKLQKDNKEAYNRQFGRYIKAGITADKLESIYTNAHKAIRAKPDPLPKATEHYKLKKPQDKKHSSEERRRLLNERLVKAGLAPRE